MLIFNEEQFEYTVFGRIILSTRFEQVSSVF